MTSGNRERFRAAAAEQRPDTALLCLLIGVEAEQHGITRPGRSAVRGTRGDGSRPGHGRTDTARAPRSDRAGAGTEGAGPDGAGAEEGTETDEARTDAAQTEEARIDAAQIELDRLAGLLPAGPHSPRAWAEALRDLLAGNCGFHGTPADYRRLDSSLLQRVLEQRRGLPILLSVVWNEVARRAGAPVYGLGLPGHFVVGFGDPAGEHTLADPFDGGRLLTQDDLEMLVAGAAGGPARLSPAMLRPAEPLETVRRVLNNIRSWAAARPEQSGVQLWALDLALLLPHHPVRLRLERARLLVERGEFVSGAEALETYAEVIGAMEPRAADAARREARTARARLN